MNNPSHDVNTTPASLNGSSRNRRALPALHPRFFKIEERTLCDFLVFLEKLSAYIYANGYPENDQTPSDNENNRQTWKAFFSNDISVFLAKIFCGKPEKKIAWSLKDDTPQAHPKIFQKLDTVLAFISNLSDAVPYSMKIRSKDQTVAHLFQLLEELKPLTYQVLRSCETAGIVIDDDRLKAPVMLLRTERVDETLLEQERMTKLDANLDNFLAFSSKVISTARELFHESVHTDQRHNPAMALLIAFLKLYGYVQEDLNRITGQHLDYFFKTLLNQQTRPPCPDQVHVCFRLSDHVDTCLIEKGALFRAGLDSDGLDCLYEAEDFVTLNKTQVTGLASFYISKKEEIGIEPHFEFISAIYKSELLSSDGGFDFPSRLFPAFGEEQYDIRHKTMERSEIGFAIASPVLLLSEGTRKIDLSLQFNLKSMSTLVAFFERYSKNEKLSADMVFHKVFSEAFKLSLTSSKGWFSIVDYKVLPPHWGSGKVEVSFTLPMGAPAITPMNEEWEMDEIEKYSTPWPVLKVCLSDERSMYAYSYLKHLVINECEIKVDVKGVKNLEVYNDLGKIETSTPFFPFGPTPVAGSSFVIGYDELYKKYISDFSLEITWHNLPKNAGGFKEYYQEYQEDVDNSSFKVGVTALSDYEFHPKATDQVQVFSLFSTAGGDNDQSSDQQLSSKTLLHGFDVKALRINTELEPGPLQPYDNSAKNGYVRIELVAPTMGFGHQEYATLMPAKIMKKVKDGDIRLPNPPFVPQMKMLSLNYAGSAKINFNKLASAKADAQAKEKVYQLQPFGIRTIFKECSPVADNLFPQYYHNGYLILGLDTVIPGEPVTLYFALEQSVAIDNEVDMPELEWYFVSEDSWVPFDTRSIIFDTTRNFITSGIVKLVMPFTITANNTILPKNKYWIIVGLKGDPRLTGKIRGVYTQALSLRWKSHKPGALWESNIPAGTIESMIVSRSDLAAIFQPMPSFGGRPAEGIHDFYTRVSERLSHKNRGVTAWDIERLVLEKFPSVSQVKCLTSIEHEKFVPPGKLMVVVVPSVITNGNFVLPRFNAGELKSIQQYIEKHVSPFVTISVINPAYEEVKVTANIVLVDEAATAGNEDELHRDVRSFICPWSDYPDNDMVFGGSIDLDDLSDFLASRPYVKSVSRISIVIVHYNNKTYTLSDSVVSTDDNKTLYASRPWSVLIPMRNHRITIQEKDQNLTPEKAAIENMRLGNEFVLADQRAEGPPAGSQPDEKQFTDYITFDIDL